MLSVVPRSSHPPRSMPDRTEAPSATETAREAFRRLARDKLAPTPENFAAMYYGILGGYDGDAPATAQTQEERRELDTALALVGHLPLPPARREALAAAIRKRAWHAVDSLLADTAQMEPARSDQEVALRDAAVAALKCSAPLYRTTAELQREAVRHLRMLDEDLRDRTPSLDDTLNQFARKLAELRRTEQRTHLQVRSLLGAVIDSVGAVSTNEGWLSGQMSRVESALRDDADMNTLAAIEMALRNAARQQGDLKRELDKAKNALKEMLNAFIARLGDMARSTGEFHERVDTYVLAIESAQDMPAVTEVVKCLLSDTRNLQDEVSTAREELTRARSEAAAQEARATHLEQQLDAVSELVRTDHLTQALNRRGLDAAYESETARAARADAPVCLALIDIDNFKMLNDRHGHRAGDEALIHLSKVIRDAIRPEDVLARIGGEEFVVLLPNTSLDAAVTIAERLQRRLTREFFLQGDEKLFITFSAGVTQVRPGEAQQAAIDRADHALYEAKRTGRNRVVMG